MYNIFSYLDEMKSMNRISQYQSRPAIGITPYGVSRWKRLSSLPIEKLHWPLCTEMPVRLLGGTVRDLLHEDHLIVHTRKSIHLPFRDGIKAQLSLFVHEPDVIHLKHVRLLRFSTGKFYRILTFNEELLNFNRNARLLLPAFTMIQDYKCIYPEKSRMVSLIASEKNNHEGHKLRHEIIREIDRLLLDVDIIGRKYRPIKDKVEGLSNYRYSVVIENSQQKYYFTEKLIDALVCETVPIYWGAPDIDEYFDSRGIIHCKSFEDIIHALHSMSIEDYRSRMPAIMKNKKTAIDEFSHINPIEKAARLIYSEI